MSLFTTESRIPDTGIATMRRFCQVGNDIWLFQRDQLYNFWINKINLVERTTVSIDYKIVGGNLEIYEEFNIYSSNGKIYMWARTNIDEILEFDPLTLELKLLAEPSIECTLSKFFIFDNKMYINNIGSEMMIMCMDTFEVIKTVNLSTTHIDRVVLLEMNGLIYMVKVAVDGMITFYQYDDGNGEFQQTMEKNEQETVRLESCLPFYNNCEEDTFVCSCNNKVYVAIKCHERILITCFDMLTKKCHTVMDNHFGDNEVINMFARDNKINMICRRFLEVVVREIDMDPSLETIALVQAADMVMDDSPNYNACRHMIPYGLRTRFDNTVSFKRNLSILTEMEGLIQKLGSLTLEKNDEVVHFMKLQQQQQIQMEQGQLFWFIMIKLYRIKEITRAMGDVKEKFVKLQYKFLNTLEEQRLGRGKDMKQIEEKHIMKFGRLPHHCLEVISQPQRPILYLIPMETESSVVAQQTKHIEDISEIEAKLKQQNEKFILENHRIGRFMMEYRTIG